MTYVGKYKMIKSVGSVQDQKVCPVVLMMEVKKDGDEYTMISEISPSMRTEIKFKIGEEFDEINAYYLKSKSIITQDEDNMLTHIQNYDGWGEVRITYNFMEDSMNMTVSFGTDRAFRLYTKA